MAISRCAQLAGRAGDPGPPSGSCRKTTRGRLIDALEGINGNGILYTTVHSSVSGDVKLASNHYKSGGWHA